ncbi:hypothetical protein CHARACLAT_006005 [Characodon lateralis]|uniref:Uncharacterized protein n=1 Tax=Characodon lateralis TaxID=208331 RepID=A0ABU7DE54_9TELE|nr:hypothetical protein [Characodon lateralis]
MLTESAIRHHAFCAIWDYLPSCLDGLQSRFPVGLWEEAGVPVSLNLQMTPHNMMLPLPYFTMGMVC